MYADSYIRLGLSVYLIPSPLWLVRMCNFLLLEPRLIGKGRLSTLSQGVHTVASRTCYTFLDRMVVLRWATLATSRESRSKYVRHPLEVAETPRAANALLRFDIRVSLTIAEHFV